MRGLVTLLFLVGVGAGMAGHIFIAWGIWIAAGLIVWADSARRERRRAYWRQRRELQDAYYRAYLRKNGYR